MFNQKILDFLDISMVEQFLEIIIKSDHDFIRSIGVDFLVKIKNRTGTQKIIEKFLIILKKDNSWRVKFHLINCISDLLNIKNQNNSYLQFVVDIFVAFGSSPQTEIRSIWTERLYDVCNVLGNDSSTEKVLEKLEEIDKDAGTAIKVSLSKALLKLAPMVGKQKTNKYIVPLFLKYIRDENFDLRVNIFNSLQYLTRIISAEIFVQTLVPAVQEMVDNKNWRTRNKALEVLPLLSEIVDAETFVAEFLGKAIDMISDPVAAIRNNAMQHLDVYLERFGELAVKLVVSKMSEMVESKKYQLRVQALFVSKHFVEHDGVKFFENNLFELVAKLADDSVPNVRFTAAELVKCYQNKEPAAEFIDSAKTILEKLAKDSDATVVEFVVY